MPPPPIHLPRRRKIPYPTTCLVLDERVWRALPPQRGVAPESLATDLDLPLEHVEAALVRLQCADPKHAELGGSGRWYRLGERFAPVAAYLVFGAQTMGDGEISESSPAGIPPRHLLGMPGRAPIEVDVVDYTARPRSAPCLSCGAVEDCGDVLHDPECAIAREAAADASRDITTDGSTSLADAARIGLAREFAAGELGGEGGDDESPEIAQRRRDLVAGYLAGSRHAAEELAGIVRVGSARLVEDVATWIRGASVPGEESA